MDLDKFFAIPPSKEFIVEMAKTEFIPLPDDHPLRNAYYRIDLGEGDCFAHPVSISTDGQYIVLRHTAPIEPPELEWPMDKLFIVNARDLESRYVWRQELASPVNKIALPGFGKSSGTGKKPNPLR